VARYGKTYAPETCELRGMAFNIHKRCLAFLMSVAKALLHFDVPTGYQDDTGFHLIKD
jgi:hypothetical protein